MKKTKEHLMKVSDFCSYKSISVELVHLYGATVRINNLISSGFDNQLFEKDILLMVELLNSGYYHFSPYKINIYGEGNRPLEYPCTEFKEFREMKGAYIYTYSIPIYDEIIISLLIQQIHDLIINFDLFNNHYSNVYKFKTSFHFYQQLLGWGEMDELYHINLVNSMKTYPRERVLDKLESLIGQDNGVYSLVRSYLVQPYIRDTDEFGGVYDSENQLVLTPLFTIPSIGGLGAELLNICLIDLDKSIHELTDLYPGIKYQRNKFDVFITNIGDLNLANVLVDLGFDGDIQCLKPGSPPIDCSTGGRVSVNTNKRVLVELNKFHYMYRERAPPRVWAFHLALFFLYINYSKIMILAQAS